MFVSEKHRQRIARMIQIRLLFVHETPTELAQRMTEYNEFVPLHELDINDIRTHVIPGATVSCSSTGKLELTKHAHRKALEMIGDLTDCINDTARGRRYLEDVLDIAPVLV